MFLLIRFVISCFRLVHTSMEILPPELLRIVLEYSITFCKLPTPNLLKSVYPLSLINRKWRKTCSLILQDQSWTSEVSLIISRSASLSGEAMLELFRKQKIRLDKITTLSLHAIQFGTPATVFQTLTALKRVMISHMLFAPGLANISSLPKLSLAFPGISSLGIFRARFGFNDLEFPENLHTLELIDNCYASNIPLPSNLSKLQYRSSRDNLRLIPPTLTSLSFLVPNLRQMSFSHLTNLTHLEVYFSAEMIRSVPSCATNLISLSFRATDVDYHSTELITDLYIQQEAVLELLAIAPTLKHLHTLVLPSDDLLSESELNRFPSLASVFFDPVEEDDSKRSLFESNSRMTFSGLPIGLRSVPSARALPPIRNLRKTASNNRGRVQLQMRYVFQFLAILFTVAVSYCLSSSESFSDYLHMR